jgi:hypothetical protein
MATAITAISAQGVILLGLPNLESQVAYLTSLLAEKESVFNATATTAVNNITVTPNYDTLQFAFSGTLTMTPQSILGIPYNGVTAYLP